jgi:hypothetical protein
MSEPTDDVLTLDEFMLGVLIRENHEARTENRTNYLLALSWVIDAWRSDDDPVRTSMVMWAEALDLALDQSPAPDPSVQP